MEFKIKEWGKTFFYQAFLFSFILFLGIFSALKVIKTSFCLEIPGVQISFWDFLLSFFLATLLILVIIFLFKKPLKGKFLKGIFILTSFLGTLLFFEIWFSQPLALILALFLIFWWIKSRDLLIQNLLMIFAIPGIGTFLGLALDPKEVILLLILFSIYDIFAVYKTKHMVKMAQEMIKEKALFGIVAGRKLSDFKRGISEIKPGGDFIILGAGDIVFPLIFSVACLKEGFFLSFSVAFFALLGVIINLIFLFSQKERKPIPALPLISFFAIIGYLIGLSF